MSLNQSGAKSMKMVSRFGRSRKRMLSIRPPCTDTWRRSRLGLWFATVSSARPPVFPSTRPPVRPSAAKFGTHASHTGYFAAVPSFRPPSARRADARPPPSVVLMLPIKDVWRRSSPPAHPSAHPYVRPYTAKCDTHASHTDIWRLGSGRGSLPVRYLVVKAHTRVWEYS